MATDKKSIKGLKKTIALNLKAQLEITGISGNELGVKAGIARGTITRLLNEDSNATIENLHKIASTLDTEVWRLCKSQD